MSLKHPDDRTLRSFLKNPKEKEQKSTVVPLVRHALKGCDRCRNRAHTLWNEDGPQRSSAAESSYSKTFDQPLKATTDFEAKLTQERQDAVILFEELKSHPRQSQEMLITNGTRFRTWGLAEHLISECEELRFDSPQKGLDLARLAAFIADSLAQGYPEPLIEDLQARCWAHIGNNLRILSDLREAEEALRRAGDHLSRGTGDPFDRARLASFQASLHTQRSEWEQALDRLKEVLRIYRRFGDTHQVGRTLIQQGLNCAYLFRPEQAIRLLSLGLQRIEVEQEPYLVLAARHNLIFALAEAGRTREAETLLQRTRPIYEEFGDRLLTVRLGWLEGRIALDQGNLERAENCLIRAREELMQQGIVLDAALVCLDLARVLVLEQRTAELKQLALEMLPVFESRDVRREAFASFILFRKAVDAEALTLGLVKEVARSLRQDAARTPLRLAQFDTSGNR